MWHLLLNFAMKLRNWSEQCSPFSTWYVCALTLMLTHTHVEARGWCLGIFFICSPLYMLRQGLSHRTWLGNELSGAPCLQHPSAGIVHAATPSFPVVAEVPNPGPYTSMTSSSLTELIPLVFSFPLLGCGESYLQFQHPKVRGKAISALEQGFSPELNPQCLDQQIKTLPQKSDNLSSVLGTSCAIKEPAA